MSEFQDGRYLGEEGACRQLPALIQDRWSWRETKEGALLREFQVNLHAGSATARKDDNGSVRQWTETVWLEPGRAFMGFGFVLALRGVRNRLVHGERIELQIVGFTWRPRVAAVEVSYGGVDEMRMADGLVRGDRFVLRAKVPWFARLFIRVPDSTIWLTRSPPSGSCAGRGSSPSLM